MFELHCAARIPGHRALSWLAPRLGAGLALAGIADLLFLDAPAPGLALALFLSLLAGVSVGLNGVRARGRRAKFAAAILTCGLFSLLVDSGALNCALALFATSLFALAMQQGAALRLTDLVPGAAVQLGAGPFRLFRDLRRMKRLTRFKQKLFTLAGLIGWIVPVGALLLFGALLAQGNPLLDRWFESLFALIGGNGDLSLHVVFCAFVLASIWSLIHLRRVKIAAPRVALPTLAVNEDSALFGAQAMVRALVLLNGLFALQSLTDIAFLWGGLSLPDGMTYASYAHRGAYPLVLTALLAAVFVLLAMRRGGPAENSRLIRPLVLAWTGQNILLVVSSIFRLKLYVAAYSLSELRVHAFVWMVLVACGLALIIAQILRRHSNAWLLEMNARALALALFGVSLINIPGTVAAFNVAHCREAGGEGPYLDEAYLVSLGPEAIPALDAFLKTPEGDILRPLVVPRIQGIVASNRSWLANRTLGGDWRSWSWRLSRIKVYLAEHPNAPFNSN